MIVLNDDFRYAEGMDFSLDLNPAQLAILIVPSRATELLLNLAAELADRGPLLVLDGGNRFNAYPVARRLHDPTALERLQVARAFTCFQMQALLQSTKTEGPALLVIDPLATFNDENVPASERQYTFRCCVAELARLSHSRPVGIGILDRPDPLGLIDYLVARASRSGDCRIYRLEAAPPAASLQPRLI
jgi:hypothetical protein